MFEYDLALQYVDKVLELDSKNINAFMLKSVVYKDLQKIEESLQVLDELLIIKPKSEQANFNKSIILLQAGRLRQGWAQYEWRWKIKDWTSLPPQTIKPLWNGEKEGILFLWPEQGIGDEVMFASIFNDLKRGVGKLIIKIDLRLMEIYKRSFPNITFILSKDNLNEYLFDYHLPIGSLPKFYRNELTDFDASNSGFLLTNEIIDKEVKNRLSKYANKRKIGVSWRSKNPLSGLKRSISLADIIAYINDEEAVFINLQYGDVNEEISELQRSGIEIINISEIDNMKNIDGLLSIINGCDEVVSIDNSTVHFAGAIGKKTQVLMHESADFRWEMQGETTKWYKSLSLKRNIII
jgi:tetratricopeptide (TPR) repeat protein